MRFSAGSFGERLRNLPNRDVSIVVALLLALIFTNNVFHFSQYRINKVFDQTSEGLVVGRLARSASDGIFSERAELGVNLLESQPPEQRGNYDDQIRYFEHPELIKTEGALWGVYPSQFGLQGIFYALIDSIDPLPRRYRIGFYHFLSALICAAAFMWVAYKIRDRFGFAAATGFVIPVLFEPMFTALGPNLYWAVGLWFVPMAIAMDIAGAESRKRRWWLIVASGAAVFAKSLCGYEIRHDRHRRCDDWVPVEHARGQGLSVSEHHRHGLGGAGGRHRFCARHSRPWRQDRFRRDPGSRH